MNIILGILATIFLLILSAILTYGLTQKEFSRKVVFSSAMQAIFMVCIIAWLINVSIKLNYWYLICLVPGLLISLLLYATKDEDFGNLNKENTEYQQLSQYM
jgi:anaerobic C4-dicarboxylate transporter